MKKFFLSFTLVFVCSFLNIEAKAHRAIFNSDSTIVVKDSNGYEYTINLNDPLQVRQYQLKNGLKVFLSVNTREPRIYTRITVRTGSRNDPPDNTGLAHYLEHLLFKGTMGYGTKNFAAEEVLLKQISRLYESYRRTTDTALRKTIYSIIDSISFTASKLAIANEYDKMMQIIGAQGTNAYTNNDETVYLNDIPSNQVNKWLEIEAERFRNPVFRLFHTELEAVYEEKNRSLDNDNSKLFETLFQGLFMGHPYGMQTTIGTVEHLKNPSITAIEGYFKQWYVPGNMALIMAGDFNPDSLIRQVDHYFSSWYPRDIPIRPEARMVHEIKIKEYTVVGPTPALVALGFRAPSGKEYKVNHALVLNELLYNGKAGLMDLNLNLAQKLQGAYAFTYPMAEAGAHILIGMPKQGQSLKEVRELLLEELEKVKKGEFDETMLKAIVDNLELALMKAEKENNSRAAAISKAFTLGYNWSDYQQIRYGFKEITKENLISFVNEYYTDNFVTVFKEEGIDSSIQKIEKPKITPIELNKNVESEWLKTRVYKDVERIKPTFLNYSADIQKHQTPSGLDFYYIQNQQNEQFSLYYLLDMGRLNDLKTAFAVDYLPYLGTNLYSPDQLQRKFYSLAAEYGVSSSDDRTYIYLSGLQKNFDSSLVLFEHLIANVKPDQEALKSLVQATLKDREDAKKQKNVILMRALSAYARFGKDNPFTYKLSQEQLQSLKAEELTTLIKKLFDYKHYIFYFGPEEVKPIMTKIGEHHQINNKLLSYPKAKTFKAQKAPKKNEVLYVPFNMVQAEVLWLRNTGKHNVDEIAVARLFNEYFDGSMGSVVFQELRESKALAYSTSARFNSAYKLGDQDYVMAYIGTQSDKLMDAVPAMNKLFFTPPTQERQIRIAKDALKQKLETQRITDEAIFFNYLSNKRLGREGKPDLNQMIYDQLDGINMARVAEFQQTHFGHTAYTYCIIASPDRVSMNNLQKIGRLKQLSLEEIFGY